MAPEEHITTPDITNSASDEHSIYPKPKGRKRKRKDSDSKGSKVPMTNKERAQMSRDRKKKYVDILEQKIEALQEQVNYLSVELDRYKKKELVQKTQFSNSPEQSVPPSCNLYSLTNQLF